MYSFLITLAEKGSEAVSNGQNGAPASGDAAQNNPLTGMVPILLIFGLMILLMFRSQKKQKKQREQLMDSIKKGDKVITAGGLYGTIFAVKEATFVIEIADGVKIEIAKAGVSGKVNPEAEAAPVSKK